MSFLRAASLAASLSLAILLCTSAAQAEETLAPSPPTKAEAPKTDTTKADTAKETGQETGPTAAEPRSADQSAANRSPAKKPLASKSVVKSPARTAKTPAKPNGAGPIVTAAQPPAAKVASKPREAAPSDEAPAAPAGKHLLRYKFTAGETIRWLVEHRATIKTTIQGTSQTAWTSSDSIKVWKIDDVDSDGEFTITHLVERVKMVNQISGRAKVEWDSAARAEAPAGFQDAAKAVGVPLTEIRMNALGQVSARKEKLEQTRQDETPIAIPLPEEPIAIGHVWNEPHEIQVTLKGGGKKGVQTRRRFELKSVEGGIATIGIDFQILTPLHEPALESQLVQRLTQGEAKFDIAAGRVIAQQLDVDKRLHDFSGPASIMQYRMRFTEKLAGDDPQKDEAEEEVAKQPATSTKK